MWEYLFYIFFALLFAYVWYELGSKRHPENIEKEIADKSNYVKSLEEEIEKLKCQLTSLHIHNTILDEELNGYQSGKDQGHA